MIDAEKGEGANGQPSSNGNTAFVVSVAAGLVLLGCSTLSILPSGSAQSSEFLSTSVAESLAEVKHTAEAQSQIAPPCMGAKR